MYKEKIYDFVNNIDNKKLIEIKFGKKINYNIFNTNIEENFIHKLIKKYKNYDNKYYNDRVYYYNNLQMIASKNGEIKCFQDNTDIEILDISLSDIDLRILSRERNKIEEFNFPCQKDYGLICNRELLSIVLQDNLRINIYNKKIENNSNYEFSIQFVYNSYKKEKIKEIINMTVSIIKEINEL